MDEERTKVLTTEATKAPSNKTNPRPLTVQLFDDALRDSGFRDPSEHFRPLDQLSMYPSITAVSLAFNLNEAQHKSFSTFASTLLQTWRSIHTNSDVPNPNRLKHVMNGAGGTGKSEVIKALQSFAILWGQPKAVKTIASTGIAAVNVCGRTIHSALELSINIPKSGYEKKKPTPDLITSWYFSLVRTEISPGLRWNREGFIQIVNFFPL